MDSGRVKALEQEHPDMPNGLKEHTQISMPARVQVEHQAEKQCKLAQLS